MQFENLLKYLSQRLEIVESKNGGYKHTLIVMGEMHYLPLAQCELLRALDSLGEIGLRLVGKEGARKIPFSPHLDLNEVMNSREYMRHLLEQKVNAVTVFGNTYPGIIIEPVDDPYLREVSMIIDKRCHELFRLKQEKSWQNMSTNERDHYDYWFNLLKEILLGDRSDFMVRNLYNKQRDLDAQFAVLVCGAGHTPFIEEYRPFSVLKMLNLLPVNFIIAIVPSVRDFLGKKDPFDFYSLNDKSEVNPYHS